MGSVAKNGLQHFMVQLQRHPLRTKAILAGVLSAVSDVVSQKLTGIQKLQLRRLLLKVLVGAAYIGPFSHYTHILLDKIFLGKNDTKTVAKKVLFEQLTISPWNNLVFMVYYGLAVEGRPWFQVKAKVKKDYPALQYSSWMVWPLFGWIKHQYVPLHLRVVFQALVGFCWGIFLNLRARSVALPKPK